eukprot:2742207-Pleurochrysis_carterae.AAC.1
MSSSCTGGDRRRTRRGRGVERRRRAYGIGAQNAGGARCNSDAMRRGEERGPTHCTKQRVTASIRTWRRCWPLS